MTKASPRAVTYAVVSTILGLIGCARPRTPPGAYVRPAGARGDHGCSSVRHPTLARGDVLFTFAPPVNEEPSWLRSSSWPATHQAEAWAAEVQSSEWWRERRQRDARFGFDPSKDAVGIEPIKLHRIKVDPTRNFGEWDGFLVHVRWSVPGTAVVGQPLARRGQHPHGDAYLYFDGSWSFDGTVSLRDSYLIVEQEARDPVQAVLSGAMLGDDGRWVLFGTESAAPEDRREHSRGYGWIAWFEGTSLHVERRTCTFDIRQ